MVHGVKRGIFVLAATFAVHAPASAQKFVPFSCQNSFNPDQTIREPVTACGRAVIGRELLIHNADVIRRVTAVSFGVGPAMIEPTGYGDVTQEQAAIPLQQDSSAFVSPAAGSVAAAPAPSWNLWADGKYTWNDSSPAVFDLDGPLYSGMFGIDYKIGSRVTLGVMGSVESSHLKGLGLFPPDIKSDGLGIGPYFGVTLTPNIIWSGNFLYSNVDSSQNAFYHFDSERYQAATAVTGYWFKDTWRFSPSVSLSWSKEYQSENAGLAADETIEAAILSPSVQIGDTLKLSDNATVEPWIGAALDWTFVNRVNDATLGVILDDPTTDLRFQGGVNFGLGSNVQLALTAELGGLLLDNSNTYSGEANLAIQF